MKEVIKKYAIVRETSAESFESELNARLYELRDLAPSVAFAESGEYMTARIEYKERIETPDKDISEEGYRFSCEDCPLFEHLLKKDGTEDGRIKYGNCPKSQFGRTWKRTPACDLLYRMIENGEVSLCFTD